MNMTLRVFSWLAVAGLLASAANVSATPALPVINTANVVNITTFGAVSSATLTNTTAIQNAINSAATTNGGCTVEIPAGTYLCGPITLASSINLQVDAGAILRMLPFGQYPVTWTTNATNFYFTANNFISGSSLHDIEISGSGIIDGQGEPWWPWANTNGAVRPIMLQLESCNRELIQNVTLSNSPMFHIAIGGNAGNSTVQGVTVIAPSSEANPPSHNTDACDVSGTNILVQNCNISVGDDDFTCGGGTFGVLLTNNTYGNGHGVSIGSYTDDGGVSNITVINCTFNGTDNGIRIKSDDGRGGLVQNISYYNIGMTNVDFPIQVYSYYNEIGTPSSVTPLVAATEPVAAVSSTTPIYRDITFSNINATSVSGYPIGIVWARTEMPATNIVFDKVNITCLYNVSGAQFIDCNLQPSSTADTFVLYNAQAVITNSAPTNRLFLFDGITTNGYDSALAFYNAAGTEEDTNAFGNGPLTLAASTFTVSNNLTLFPTTVLNFTLGTNAATLAVTGNLTLGGTNNISAGAGFTGGTYTLMTCAGALNGTLPVLGSVPAGYNCSIETNTARQVELVAVSTTPQPPSAPTNLVAVAGNGSVALTWSPVTTATNYNVQRSLVSGGPYVTNSSVTVTNYTDTQVTNGTTYYYVVSAVNANGESANSTQVSATPQTISLFVTTNVFSDGFSSSSVDSLSQSAPTAAGTSYETISSKSWNPTPTTAAGHLKFGIAATSSGSIEVQALFTNSPVTLAASGDSISLTVTFTNASGLLAESGAMGFGLYCSGGNYPVPGGLNGVATAGVTTNATGYAQTWAGYVGQLAFTGANSQIMTRPPQVTGPLNNNDQDTVTSGSGSSSYTNNLPVTVGTASSTPSVTLVAGNPYTEVLTLTLSAANTLAITNSLYSGTNTSGTLLSQFGGVASGTTYLTNAFDALAVGWRATVNTFATAIDINQISVSTTRALTTIPTNSVSLVPTNIVSEVVGNQLQLSWPTDHIGWTLQIQTNSLSNGLGTNWVDVGGSAATNEVLVPINPANGSVFLRLIYANP
jgi:hypothetical protein